MLHRYENEAIRELWTPTAIYGRWFEVEVEYLREIAGADAAEALAEIGPPTQREVAYHEQQTGHDVAGFLRAVDAKIQRAAVDETTGELRAKLHYGLTSSDLVDTGLAMGLTRSWPIVVGLVDRLQQELCEISMRLLGQTTVGRTHGQLASMMPAGHRWRVLCGMAVRSGARLQSAFEEVRFGKLSGPVGISKSNRAKEALGRLGLNAFEQVCSQIVPRDGLAHWAQCMAAVAAVCDAIATQIWLLAQSGIEEVRVADAGEVGSSAMPHKRNPIVAENIRGLARLAQSSADSLRIGMVQWGEHDLAHSSVERVAVPDLLHLVCTAASRTAALVQGLTHRGPVLPEHYRDTSAMLRALQAQGTPYVDAHARLSATYRDGKIPANTATQEETH